MAGDKVRIGFIGTGSMGQCAHLKHYVLVPECSVVALAEIRPKLANEVAARYGVPRVYSDHRKLLANEKLDAIVAIQPFSRHGILVPELLEAGVPLLTEKPLASSIETGRGILDALAKSGTWMMLAYNKRSDPASMFARSEIDRLKSSGELGRMKYVRITMPPGDWIQGGFDDMIKTDDPVEDLDRDPPASDMDEETFRNYKSIVNYYIHQINLLRFLMGEPYSVTHADQAGVLLVTKSQSGVTGVIEMAPYNTTRDWQESVLVCFEKGWIRLDMAPPLAANRPGRVTMFRDSGDTTPETVVPSLPWVSSMRQQAVNFVKAVRGEAKPPCEAAEGLEDLKVARDYIRLFLGG